jgi:hypothetical protein
VKLFAFHITAVKNIFPTKKKSPKGMAKHTKVNSIKPKVNNIKPKAKRGGQKARQRRRRQSPRPRTASPPILITISALNVSYRIEYWQCHHSSSGTSG